MLNRKKTNAEAIQNSNTIKDAKDAEISPKKKKSHALKIVGIVEGVFIFLMMFFSIMTIGTNLQPTNKGGISRIPLTESALFTVRTDSMNPTFKKGDMIYGQVVDVNKFDFSKIVANESIITFKYIVSDDKGKAINIFNTHRVVRVDKYGENYIFTTKGDHPSIAANQTEEVQQSEVIAVYKGKVPLIGNFVNSLQQNRVLFFCVIILPLILLFVANAVYFVRIFYVSGKEQAVENAIQIKDEEMAKIREEARKQALEELQKEQKIGKEK